MANVKLMIITIACGLAACSSPEEQADLPIAAGVDIVIDGYAKDSARYAVYASRFPGEGCSYVTPEALSAAVKSIELNSIRSNPLELLGKNFETTAELKTVMLGEGEQLELRSKDEPVCNGEG